jgi:hypothetical protein
MYLWVRQGSDCQKRYFDADIVWRLGIVGYPELHLNGWRVDRISCDDGRKLRVNVAKPALVPRTYSIGNCRKWRNLLITALYYATISMLQCQEQHSVIDLSLWWTTEIFQKRDQANVLGISDLRAYLITPNRDAVRVTIELTSNFQLNMWVIPNPC